MSTLKDFNFKDKKALIRVDFNVPLDENLNVTDDTRIQSAKNTILKVLEDGGSCILMSHLGRPKAKESEFSLKNIISKDPELTPEEKAELHNRVIELYKLEVADRDSARSREVEISKVRKFDFMFNLTGLVGLGTFVFLVYCIVYITIPESNEKTFYTLIGLCEGIVLSIFGFYFGSIAKK